MTMYKISGGPGSGVLHENTELIPLNIPISPKFTIGNRKGILETKYDSIETIRIKDIKFLGQKKFVPKKLKEMLSSHDKDDSPVSVVRDKNNNLHLIDGHHRFLKAIIKGYKTIRAMIWSEGRADNALSKSASHYMIDNSTLHDRYGVDRKPHIIDRYYDATSRATNKIINLGISAYEKVSPKAEKFITNLDVSDKKHQASLTSTAVGLGLIGLGAKKQLSKDIHESKSRKLISTAAGVALSGVGLYGLSQKPKQNVQYEHEYKFGEERNFHIKRGTIPKTTYLDEDGAGGLKRKISLTDNQIENFSRSKRIRGYGNSGKSRIGIQPRPS